MLLTEVGGKNKEPTLGFLVPSKRPLRWKQSKVGAKELQYFSAEFLC